MTPDEAKRFNRDGYLRLRGVVPRDLALEARRLIFARIGELRSAARAALRDESGLQKEFEETVAASFTTGGSPIFTDLLEKTPLKRVIEKGMGTKMLPVRGAQLATLFPGEFDEVTNESGYLNRETPFYGWTGHLDGLWNGGTAVPKAGTNIRGRHLAAWRCAPSTNGMGRTFPEHNCNMANFTALVGVALSDQRSEGAGNLGLLRGAHKHMERFFQQQRDMGGPLGPDGPGWSRENPHAPNHHGLVHYPEAVRERYRARSANTSDGQYWPEPDLMRLSIGDAVIVHFSTPHSATLVTRGSEPRLMVYFRCTSSRRPEQNRRIYPEALCDNLLEWRGVKRLIQR
jgi:hypothetical protein